MTDTNQILSLFLFPSLPRYPFLSPQCRRTSDGFCRRSSVLLSSLLDWFLSPHCRTCCARSVFSPFRCRCSPAHFFRRSSEVHRYERRGRDWESWNPLVVRNTVNMRGATDRCLYFRHRAETRILLAFAKKLARACTFAIVFCDLDVLGGRWVSFDTRRPRDDLMALRIRTMTTMVVL